jgi:hypothetical protein
MIVFKRPTKMKSRCFLLLLLTVCFAEFLSNARAQGTATTNTAAPVSPIIAASKITLSDYPLEGPKARQIRWVTTPLNRKKDPTNSTDSHFDWWPTRNTNEWIEAAFAKPETISGMQLYWFNDSQKKGGCGLPVSWRAFYKDQDQWKPVDTTNTYTVSENQFDTISFKSITTTGVRLEVQLQTNWSGGIEAWKLQ